MAIETRCTSCETILRIADEHAGKQARCPQCHTEYQVPEQTDDDALDAVCHYCSAPLPSDHQADEEFKACAECAESIQENQLEIEAELEAAEGWRKSLLVTALLIGGAVAIFFLVDWLHDYLSVEL